MKTYAEVIAYLYDRLPMFTRQGAKAIRPDLKRTLLFCEALGNPHKRFPSVHVAGTNGKGSSSHMLASILAAAGYRTGLYTSPHLVDFRERIRIDGKMIPPTFVESFVQRHLSLIEKLKPSFFEVTVCMAFDYFAQEEVDVAIIEVGLGGRLDSTNIIDPLVSLITNIGLDHVDLLGDTLGEIAREKAGIIKPYRPVVISERQSETEPVFRRIAEERQSPSYFADEQYRVTQRSRVVNGLELAVEHIRENTSRTFVLDLTGAYQEKNLLGVLTVVDRLREKGYKINDSQLATGLRDAASRTALKGRWQTLNTNPWTICDTAHNEEGIRAVLQNMEGLEYNALHVVLGAMKDKDLSSMLALLPKTAQYYFCAPDMPRAIASESLCQLAATFGLYGQPFASIEQAVCCAESAYRPGDLIFIGGSTFVVAELLANRTT